MNKYQSHNNTPSTTLILNYYCTKVFNLMIMTRKLFKHRNLFLKFQLNRDNDRKLFERGITKTKINLFNHLYFMGLKLILEFQVN